MRAGSPWAFILACASALSGASAASAFSGGAPEGFSGGPASGFLSCAVCHAEFPENSGPGSISITGLPPLYVPNESYVLRVRVEDPSKVGAGFQLSAEDPAGLIVGELSIIDGVNTRNAGSGAVGFITHTTDGKANAISNWTALSDGAEFDLQWRAPSGDIGPVTFYAAGVAINNGNGASGDFVYTTSAERGAASLGDLNGDGVVDTADLGLLIRSFGTNDPVADLNGDALVDTMDLSLLISAFQS